MMELKKNLHVMSERASELYERVNDEICKSNDLFYGSAKSKLGFLDCQNLIDVRDSLKDVENKILFLQEQESRQQMELHEAFICLEESKLILTEKVNQFQGNENRFAVIQELKACLAAEKPAFPRKRKEKTARKIERNKITGFLVYCIKSLFNPLNLLSTAKLATKIIVLSASISSVLFSRQIKKHLKSGKKNISLTSDSEFSSTCRRKTGRNSSFDVLYGKG